MKRKYNHMLMDQMILPKSLILRYKELNITENELVLLIHILRLQLEGNQLPSVQVLSQLMTLKEHEIAQLLRDLMKKKLISIEQHKEDDVIYEAYSLEPLLQSLYVEENKVENEQKEQNIFILFEQEFGRALSPIEIEMINHWLDDDQLLPALIKAALREAVLMGKLNFRYIDRILNEWSKKGVKTVDDARRVSQAFRQASNNNSSARKKEKRDTSIYYNWLDEEK